MGPRSGAVLIVLLSLAAAAAGGDIPVISHGERVDLVPHLVSGKYVLFDFYANWCANCRQIDPQVRGLAERFPDRLAVRKVDIVDWKSAVTAQYELSAIPHLKLFDPSGSLVAEGDAELALAVLKQSLGVKDPTLQPSALPVLAFAVIGAFVVWRIVRRGK